MARKECTVTIPGEIAENRDAGRSFQIVEMSAMKAEKWATRALLAFVSSGIDLDEDVNVNGGIQELAKFGIQAFMGLKFEFIEPLLDEMLGCCHYLRTPGDTTSKTQLTVDNCDNYIEEVSTLLKLRTETLSLHLGFSLAEKISASLPGQDGKTEDIKPNTQTPPDTLGQSFPEKWQQSKN
jgi:hypothetical protein